MDNAVQDEIRELMLDKFFRQSNYIIDMGDFYSGMFVKAHLPSIINGKSDGKISLQAHWMRRSTLKPGNADIWQLLPWLMSGDKAEPLPLKITLLCNEGNKMATICLGEATPTEAYFEPLAIIDSNVIDVKMTLNVTKFEVTFH